MSKLQPEVGDIVLIKARVSHVYRNKVFKPEFIDCEEPGQFTAGLNITRIHQILERPIKIGDTVWFNRGDACADHERLCPMDGVTLLHTHQDEGNLRPTRAVVAYKSDAPYSVPFNCLRKTP